jgi:cytochrome c
MLIMKKLFFILLSLSLFSCKQEEKKEELYPEDSTSTTSEGATADMTASEKLGKEIFDGKGNCFSCHRPEQKVIGPSIVEIAKIYKEKNGSMVDFLKEKAEPIVDPSQYAVMKTNFSITKNLTDEELKGLEDYIYSFQSQSQ